MRTPGTALSLSLLLLGCGGSATPAPDGPSSMGGVVLTTLKMDINPGVPVGAEIYQCFMFDLGAAKGAAVHSLRWTPPPDAFLLHHGMLFATPTSAAPGLVPCDPMPPAATVLPLYAPGGETAALPEGVSIVIPQTSASVFVELHLLRTAGGAASATVDFLANDTAPAHLAGWVDDYAPVPALAPGAAATSTANCGFGGPVHVVASWPHMHRLGSEFVGTIVRANGGREPLLDVPAWDVNHQPLYTVDATLDVGESIETACSWNNTTGGTVNEGPYSSDEMCNQGLVVWPQENAYCVR